MRRWIGTLLAALIVAAPLLAVDKGADEKGNDRATQFKNIQTDYQKAVPDAKKALKEAKTSEERDAVFARLNMQFAPRIIKLVEVNPKDNLSLQMLTFAVRALPKVDGKVFDLLAENWAKDEKIKTLCLLFILQPQDGAKKLLQNVLDANKDTDAKGFACFALAKLAAGQASKGEKKAGDEAEKYYERVTKDFARVSIPRSETTLGDQAKGALFEIRHLSVGKTPPNVVSQGLDGKKVELKDYKGKVVVLDIWATWCPPCRSMIPHEREMVKKHKDAPFALISISGDDEKDTLKKFLETNDMPWIHWWDGRGGNIIKGWNIESLPTIYVLDPKGVIRYKFVGAVTEELDTAVDKLLAEAKSKK